MLARQAQLTESPDVAKRGGERRRVDSQANTSQIMNLHFYPDNNNINNNMNSYQCQQQQQQQPVSTSWVRCLPFFRVKIAKELLIAKNTDSATAAVTQSV